MMILLKKIKIMKKQKVKNSDGAFIISSNDYEDDNCAVCQLMRKCEKENTEPTQEEITKAMIESQKQGGIVGGPLIEAELKKN